MPTLLPRSIDALILEQPDRDARLSLLATLARVTDAVEPVLPILTHEEFANFVDAYATGHLPIPKKLPKAKKTKAGDAPRELFEICRGKEYHTVLAQNHYCRLAMGDKRNE